MHVCITEIPYAIIVSVIELSLYVTLMNVTHIDSNLWADELMMAKTTVCCAQNSIIDVLIMQISRHIVWFVILHN